MSSWFQKAACLWKWSITFHRNVCNSLAVERVYIVEVTNLEQHRPESPWVFLCYLHDSQVKRFAAWARRSRWRTLSPAVPTFFSYEPQWCFPKHDKNLTTCKVLWFLLLLSRFATHYYGCYAVFHYVASWQWSVCNDLLWDDTWRPLADYFAYYLPEGTDINCFSVIEINIYVCYRR